MARPALVRARFVLAEFVQGGEVVEDQLPREGRPVERLPQRWEPNPMIAKSIDDLDPVAQLTSAEGDAVRTNAPCSNEFDLN